LGDFSRDDWIVGVLALLLAIDLVFLPWFSISAGIFGASLSYSGTGWPDGWLGVLAVITSIALLADLVIERSSPGTALPNIGGSRANTRFVLAGLTALFVALKFLFHLHPTVFGFGFWAAALLTIALVYSTLRVSRDQPIISS
jgi:hypothetical protein